jgi:hypothetical protein
MPDLRVLPDLRPPVIVRYCIIALLEWGLDTVLLDMVVLGQRGCLSKECQDSVNIAYCYLGCMPAAPEQSRIQHAYVQCHTATLRRCRGVRRHSD